MGMGGRLAWLGRQGRTWALATLDFGSFDIKYAHEKLRMWFGRQKNLLSLPNSMA